MGLGEPLSSFGAGDVRIEDRVLQSRFQRAQLGVNGHLPGPTGNRQPSGHPCQLRRLKAELHQNLRGTRLPNCTRQ